MCSLPNRSVEQHAALAEALLNGLDQFVELDVVGVHLVDDQHASQAALAGLIEHAPGVHLDAVGSGDDDDRRLDGTERLQRGTDEIGVAGSIEDVNLLPLVFQDQQTGINRVVPFLFFLVVVGNAGAVVHAAAAVHRLGLKQKVIGQRGLARCSMSHQGDIANVFHTILGHAGLLTNDEG